MGRLEVSTLNSVAIKVGN